MEAMSAARPLPAANNPTDSALGRLLAKNRALVMGILNLTPDSFSDGGRYVDPRAAIAHATAMAKAGADIIDVGAESTRPYGDAVAVSFDEEVARLAPTFPAVVGLGVPVSIDTMKARVAAWAIETGAAIVNDVWGLQRDPDMARVVAEYRVPVIVMHNRLSADAGIDIVTDVVSFFEHSLEIAERAGIARDMIVLDPGVGFGKTPEQSIRVVAQLDAFRKFNLPLLVGVSRKRFIASIVPSDPGERLGGSIAAHVLAVIKGAAIVRTHDVAETMQALRVADAIREAT
jgi:dihydropteroate synthase